MAAIELRAVTKEYPRGVLALVDLSLEARDGELLVLLGPSGCGKTTTLRLIAGLDPVTRGTILFDDTPVNDTPPHKRNVAMVFQHHALYPHMTARRNLEFPLRMKTIPRAQINERVLRTAGLLGIADLLDRRPGELSGGEQQRVAMGRALVREPGVFLLDEPLSFLDPTTRAQLRTQIAEIQRRTGITMICVTHDQSEAMLLGSRIAVLREGRLQQVGTPREIYDRPVNTFVARFVGGPGMNILPGTLRRDPGGAFHIELEPLRIRIDTRRPDRPSSLQAHVDQPVLVGIRPEGIFRANASPPRPDAKELVVASVQVPGAEQLVTFEPPDDRSPALVARWPARDGVRPGERIGVAFDAERVCLFDESGRAI